jgi:hypothetical protein
MVAAGWNAPASRENLETAAGAGADPLQRVGLSMVFARAHVVGAGLAGLNAATLLAEAGLAVSLSDRRRGRAGRCRSYFDPSLGLTIDNGNHLVLASNPAVKAFRERIGAHEPLAGPSMPISPSPIWARASAGSCASTMARCPGGSPCRAAAFRAPASPITCPWANCCWARASRPSAI